MCSFFLCLCLCLCLCRGSFHLCLCLCLSLCLCASENQPLLMIEMSQSAREKLESFCTNRLGNLGNLSISDLVLGGEWMKGTSALSGTVTGNGRKHFTFLSFPPRPNTILQLCNLSTTGRPATKASGRSLAEKRCKVGCKLSCLEKIKIKIYFDLHQLEIMFRTCTFIML